MSSWLLRTTQPRVSEIPTLQLSEISTTLVYGHLGLARPEFEGTKVHVREIATWNGGMVSMEEDGWTMDASVCRCLTKRVRTLHAEPPHAHPFHSYPPLRCPYDMRKERGDG